MSRPTATVHLDLPAPAALTPEQQLEAVRRAQAKVEQRVKLGVQLFRAAEADLTEQQDRLAAARREQDALRQQLQDDATRNRVASEQWMAQMDDRLARAVDRMEQRLADMQSQWEQTEQRLATMLRRSETLLDQSRTMLETGQLRRPTVRT